MAEVDYKAAARNLIDFIDNSPSPFHAVQSGVAKLEAAGFSKLHETDSWIGKVKRGGKYYVTRNHSSLIAFVVPNDYQLGNGFNIIGAHTDSPCLHVSPKSKQSKEGYDLVGVQTYGGGLWHTWFDRDLTVAGRVIVAEGDHFAHKLVHLTEKPILRVSTLCIHLSDSRESFSFNNETQLVPIISTSLNESNPNKHHPILLELLAAQLQTSVDNIRDFELCLCDFQKSTIGGAADQFVFAPRLDNLGCSFIAIQSLINTSSPDALANETNVRMITLFDHEEVGSLSDRGADSNFVEHVFKRILISVNDGKDVGDALEQAFRNSFLISADMAHAVHPNYAGKHQPQHAPAINKGPVIKINDNQHYATSAWTGFFIRELAIRNSVPYQEFAARNDGRCGTTIGPILASRGIRTVDIGLPQLSMHSIREMCGVEDVTHGINLFQAYFTQFSKLDLSLRVD